MKELYIASSLLLVVFSVGDLVGLRNLAKIEKAWVEKATRYFKVWARGVLESVQVLKLVGLVSIVSLTELLLASLLVYVTVLHKSSDVIVFVYFAVLVFPVFGFLRVHSLLCSSDAQTFFKRNLSVFEVRMAYWLSVYFAREEEEMIEAIKKLEESMDIHLAGGVIFPMLRPLLVSGVIVPPFFLASLFARVAFYLSFILVWSAILMPAMALSGIAERTGSKSYFGVAKYIALVLVTFAAILAEL